MEVVAEDWQEQRMQEEQARGAIRSKADLSLPFPSFLIPPSQSRRAQL